MPPYVIFHDATLREMVEQRPRTLEELARLSGVGETKLSRYGEEFLAVITARDGAPSGRLEDGGEKKPDQTPSTPRTNRP